MWSLPSPERLLVPGQLPGYLTSGLISERVNGLRIGKRSAVSEEIRLDWSSAEVQDGRLVIALEGKPEKAWKEAFARTTRLLNRGKWDEVTVKRGSVVLQPITPGEEDRVRHFLESVVFQANSATATTQEGDDPPSDEAESAGDEEAREDSEDQQMTERLRSFAEG
jgi:hypothetical protein